MKVRLPLALIVAVVGVGLIPGPVAAGPPTEEVFSPVGDRFLCGETLVTVQSGTVLEREHVHELGSGLSHVIVIETPNDVVLTDEEGNAYRLVGTARGNFVTAADPEDEFALEWGFFAFKVNLIGEVACSAPSISCYEGSRTATSSFGIGAAVTLRRAAPAQPSRTSPGSGLPLGQADRSASEHITGARWGVAAR